MTVLIILAVAWAAGISTHVVILNADLVRMEREIKEHERAIATGRHINYEEYRW